MKMELVASLLVMSFYWLCLGNHIIVVSGLCLGDQKSLLLQFKNNLTFTNMADRNSSRLKSWNASDDCCRWMGVTCDKEGHVTALDLSRESISGGFVNSSVLFNLQHLQSLNLASNNFNSVIPSGFNNLDKLTYLNLSYAGFVGQIPIEISQLTRLITLHISSFLQHLKLEDPNLQSLVQNLTSIRQLYLDGVSISAPGYEWCSALLSLRDLQELSLSRCNLLGPLDPSLARLESLSVIALDENDLSSPVPETFAHFKSLTMLRLSKCKLTGIFPQKVFNIGTLSLIDISSNNNLHGFFPDFPLRGSLQTLRVSKTNFTRSIPPSIGNMRNLSELDLSHCGFSGKIPNSLSNLPKLNYLDMSHNRFTGPMTSFVMVKKLTHLDLSHNDLSGILPSSYFEGLQNLVHIDLSNNSFTGRTPSILFTLPSLQNLWLSNNLFTQLEEFMNVTSSRLVTLYMSNNNLSGTIPSSLFALPLLQEIRLSHNHLSQLDEFINVSSSILDTLDLSSNNLSGPFPTSIFQISTLSVLRLSSNKFNGLVHLNKLKSLTELELSYNNLSVNANFTNVGPSSFPSISYLNMASCNLKTFPGFLRNLSTLMHLDLSNNQIQGIVPNWIWKLPDLYDLNISYNLLTKLEGPFQNLTSNLDYLDLHYNKLEGPIPVFPKDAMFLDLSSNNFSSLIPRDIGNYLSQTYFLSLSNNSLHGSIPESICNASSLQMLDLSINNITGTIPPCLMIMSETLQVLNLKNNNLSGSIPDTVPASCILWSLNLHGNLLDGPIPNSLAYCSMLEVLDVGSNQISGGFPCILKEISTLRILVVRNNKFKGSLRCSESNKTWEMLQIVDIAFNNFSGKLPGKYFATWKRNISLLEEYKGQLKSIEKSFYDSEDGRVYYEDNLTLLKDLNQLLLPNIYTILTSIDVSSNHFEGPIPKDLMDFEELVVLNLSNNALSGEIPSLMDLSYNHLVGKIPTGAQFSTFSNDSYEGNEGLYGLPLSKKADDEEPEPRLYGSPLSNNADDEEAEPRLAYTIDWNLNSVGFGLVFGHGIVFGPLLVWKQWSVWYWQLVHKVLCRIFAQMYLEYVTGGGHTYTTLRWGH
ncbi:Receptor-like protein 6 [Glycine soja]|uniref:Receptor-like protein 6 n=1 Tax=Glycine soja TaxID=3848 RepID=A0A445M225_GLYSO|nr:Receptor-like protein 6 [Glycine soja]